MAIISGIARAAKAAALRSRQATLQGEEERPAEDSSLPLVDVGSVKEALLNRKPTLKERLLKSKVADKVVPLRIEPPTDEVDLTDSFVSDLGAFEGTKAHKSLEGGKATGAFGIKDSRGLVRLPKEGDKDFAKRVVRVHEEEIVDKVGSDKWGVLPTVVRAAVLDLKFNTGTVGRQLVEDIRQGEDLESIMTETLDTVKATILEDQGEFKKGDKIVSPGLARRRASRWNRAFPDKPIKEVVLKEEGRRTSITYQGDEGPIFSYSTKASISRDFKHKTGDVTVDVP